MKKMMRIVALFAALALVLAACGDDTGGGADDLELVTEGTLTVCTETPYPPMEFVDEAGNYTGFDMELVRAIAEDLDLELVVAEIGFDAITTGLAFDSGDCDVAAASITITEERATAVDFSTPYFSAEQSLLVTTESGIGSLADMVDRDLAVQTGTTGHIYAEENAVGVNIIEFEDAAGPFLALEAGTVEGFMTDLVVTQDYMDNNEGYAVVETYGTDEEYGLATKGTPNLLAAVDATLAKFRGDGTYDQIYEDWFPSA